MGKEGKEGKESKKRKSAVAEAPVVATVPLKVETEAEGVTGALLACFADAPPPEEATHGKGEISFECSRTPAGNRVLTGETARLDLSGEEPPAEAYPFKYAIGMYDPQKGRVVLLEDNGGVFPLVRTIKGLGGGSKASSLTKDQSRDQLVSAFGSKRVKKTHQERKGVQLQQDSEDTIADIHETLTVKKEEADAAKVQMGVVEAGVEAPNELAPLPNLEATAVNEVYTLAGLLSDEQWDAISDKLLIKIAADEEASKMLPSFCRANVGAVIAAADKKAKKVQARLLSYVAFLIFFHNISSRFKKDAQVLADELGIPLPIGTHFLKEFAVRDGNSYTKPQAQRDRLLLHLTTAALIFSNYDMHLDMLAADVKIHPDRVGAYFKELGAKVSKGTTQRKSVSSDEQATAAAQPIYKVTLTLPLVFPKRSRGGPK